ETSFCPSCSVVVPLTQDGRHHGGAMPGPPLPCVPDKALGRRELDGVTIRAATGAWQCFSPRKPVLRVPLLLLCGVKVFLHGGRRRKLHGRPRRDTRFYLPDRPNMSYKTTHSTTIDAKGGSHDEG